MAQVTDRVVGQPFQMIRPALFGELLEQSGNDRVVDLAVNRRGELALEHVRNLDQLGLLVVLGDERDWARSTPPGDARRLRRGPRPSCGAGLASSRRPSCRAALDDHLDARALPKSLEALLVRPFDPVVEKPGGRLRADRGP